MLRKRGFTIIKSKNKKKVSPQKIIKGTFKDYKWILRDTETVDFGKRVIFIRNSLDDTADKCITDESIV